MLLRAGVDVAPRRRARSRVGTPGRARARADRRARRPVVGRLPRRRGGARARARGSWSRDVGANWTRVGFLRILRAHGRRSSSGRSRSPARALVARRAGHRARRRPRPARRHRRSRPTRCRWRSTSCRSSRCSAASPRARRSCAAPQELRLKESDRIATVVDGPARARRRHRGHRRTASSCAGTGGLRGGAIEAHGDHRLAMLGAVAGLASREGVEVVGMEAAAVSYPGFADDLAALVSEPSASRPSRPTLPAMVDRDRRARRGREVHAWRAPSRRRSASRTSTPGRCTAPSARARRAATACRGRRRRAIGIELGDRVLLDGDDVTEAIRTPEAPRGASSVVAADPAVRAALVRQAAGRSSADGDWVAEGRDIGSSSRPTPR